MTCRGRPRQKLRPCGDAEAGGASGQTVFCLLFSVPGSVVSAVTPSIVLLGPSATVAPGAGGDVEEGGAPAGCRRGRTPSEAHMAL